MFGSIGGPELLLIFLVALLIFGPRKLPELGRMLGKGLGEFRRAANDLRVSLETEVAREAPVRGGEGSPALTTLSAAPGATARRQSAPASGVDTTPAATPTPTEHAAKDMDGLEPGPHSDMAPAATPAPAVAPDARDADRTH